MIVKSIYVLALCAAVLSKPAPKPNPISVYQQEDGGEQEYQQQPIQQYRPQVQYKPQAAPRPRPVAPVAYKQNPQNLQQQQSEDYEMEPPQPYQFQFDVNDDENTNYQNRKEQREGNKISGSYSVVDSDGFIRTVTYTADPVEGFKAHVSREPTNIVVKIPEATPQPLNSQYHAAAAAPQVKYTQKAPAGVQYSGASLARPQQIPSAPRRQQTQQYLQGSQDPYAAFQAQGSSRVSQAVAQGGQVNQYISESNPSGVQASQFSNSNTALRG